MLDDGIEIKQVSYPDIYRGLSRNQRVVCYLLVMDSTDWHWGSGKSLFEREFVNEQNALDELIEMKIVTSTPSCELAQEFLEKNKDEVERVDRLFSRESQRNFPRPKINAEDRELRQLIQARRGMAERGDDELRCRLADKGFHDWLKSQIRYA